MRTSHLCRKSLPALVVLALIAGCNPVGNAADRVVEYGTGQEYTADDYKTIGKQIANDTAFNIVPGGEVFQFAADMPDITRSYLMETFRARRDAADGRAIYAHGLEANALDAESNYYDNYIRCLSGDRASCDRVPALRTSVRQARNAAAASARGDHDGGHSH
ncbi:hypothetical protein [Paenirhodobacter hankyongi]|uniref:hypothetical protein n=1 Tax=Paenirhodobacter hankyongi TaxID=2294033 RepID=UPI0016031A32|nr:hypothetical protein [Sinirhodobacter hankyongi]